jgi:hypothetical protein
MAIDYSAVLTAIVNQMPALVTSAATLLGVYLGYRKIGARLTSIHGLVNSVHGTSLRLAATLAQRLAEATGNPGDKDVAAATKKAADEHDAKQAEQDIRV